MAENVDRLPAIAPPLLGLPIGEARRVAKKRAGATLEIKLVDSEEKPLHVVRQFPEVGDELNDRRAIQVNTVEESKAMIEAVLDNQPGPAHNIVAMNAGAAIYVAGLADTLKGGIERASQAIRSGAAPTRSRTATAPSRPKTTSSSRSPPRAAWRAPSACRLPTAASRCSWFPSRSGRAATPSWSRRAT